MLAPAAAHTEAEATSLKTHTHNSKTEPHAGQEKPEEPDEHTDMEFGML